MQIGVIMNKHLVHTPEGVRDIYGEEFARKLKIQHLIHEKLANYGYVDIQTPTFEFFDVFSKEIGTTPSKELYKFFDKEGNTLVLRPDFTPSIARCAVKYFEEDTMPIRFSYVGNTFTNTSNLQGKLKEVTQMGAELIGDDSISSDAEIISLVVDSLLHIGLTDFQISIGEVDYFKGLCIEAGLDEETELELRDYISIKNFFGAEEVLINKHIQEKYRKILLKVSDLFGSADIFQDAKKIASNEISTKSIERLEKLYEVLCIYGVEKYVSFDLGMLSKYNYYSGIIFQAYTYGVGDAVVKGGRYDNLLKKFGKDTPAIGFMFIIDDLMSALSSQHIELKIEQRNILVVFDCDYSKEAIAFVKKLRNEGENVELIQKDPAKSMEEYKLFARNKQIKRVYYNETLI